MSKHDIINYYKEMMAEADSKEFASTEYNLRKIYIILDMAQRGVVPDGSFSDSDVDMWSYFRHVLRQVNGGDFEEESS